MKSNKKLIVIISIVLILILTGAILAYLYIATDMFRSNQELFAKYLAQNEEAFQKITDFQTSDVYENLKNENKYESTTNIKLIYSEGGEISNPLNNLSLKLDVQKNNEEQYAYADGQILYEDEEYLEAEIIKEQEIYGIRFSDAVQQFITLKDDENIEEVANDIGIDAEQLRMIINMIDGNEQITSSGSESNQLKEKYLNIITSEISKGTFEKQKNAMITYNDVTTKTNAYTVLLSNEQVENMLIEILNNIKSEEKILDKLQTIVDKDTIGELIDEIISEINNEVEVPAIKITVYEEKQKTIRTDIEIGLYKISIENLEQNEEIKTKINYSNLNDDKIIQYNCEIIKKNTANQEDFQMTISIIEGEENCTVSILNQMKLEDNKIELDTEITYKQDITTISLLLQNEVDTGNDFEKIESLASGNYIVLNNVQEEKRKTLISLLKQKVPIKINERIDLLKEKFGIKDENSQSSDDESDISQVDINRFNAKFEFYTGDEVSAENVKMLLEIAKNNLGGHSIVSMSTGTEENTESTETTEQKNSITLYIEKDKTNEESMAKVLEKIDDNKKYKVSISYKESNGLIEYITITEI